MTEMGQMRLVVVRFAFLLLIFVCADALGQATHGTFDLLCFIRLARCVARLAVLLVQHIISSFARVHV